MNLASGLFVCVLITACSPRADPDLTQGSAAAEPRHGPAAVSDNWLKATGDAALEDWPTHGLDFAETRFSRLKQINDRTISELGLVWTYNLESTRGVEATPLIVDGIMYVTAAWSVVHAIDASTGEHRWKYDPQVPREQGSRGCCDVVNRGVALSGGTVFVGTFDGRLVALEAATGRRLWEQDTVIDRSRAYTITGAPRVYKGKVLIGNGGAEYGVRGYVSAYDAVTGTLRWRWYTVPGDPSLPFENDAMAEAANTWDPSNRYWEAGGGGTVWDTMAFDPDLNLIYIGTGNGSPWNRKVRSPAGGDNLYLASLVALDADTGEYVWHYQETPGDNWDYTSTQPMILADLEIGGELRKVILHAPKNGFFFVVDRTDGSFISADPFVEVNWATGYDSDGRPLEIPAARGDEPYDSIPGAYGAHNWHPMSYNPETGLAYFPAQNIPLNIKPDPDWRFNANLPGRPHSALGWNLGIIAGNPAPSNQPFGRLIAWDPAARKEAWRVEQVSPWNGGTLTSAGNLVFQGTADGRFVAYDAREGSKLWESPVGTGIVAGPVTYQIDGVQYVSVAVGWGGVYGLAQHAAEKVGPGTVFTYALGGDAPLPEFSRYPQGELVSGVAYDPAHVDEGAGLYVSHCFFCHGVPGINNGGNIPNLGYVGAEVLTNLDALLADRAWVSEGMPDFSTRLDEQDIAKLRAFIQATAEAARPH
jgi:quinohemoprotein ethanol dehydrogenase